MDVRFGAVAGVAAFSELPASGHPLANTHLHAIATQVSQEYVGTDRGYRDDDIVPGDGGRSCSHASALSQHVREKGQLRSSGFVVGFTVVSDDDSS
jgi:hypothetical protein